MHFNAQKKINWTKGLDIAMKNEVTNEYSYRERSFYSKIKVTNALRVQGILFEIKLAITNIK